MLLAPHLTAESAEELLTAAEHKSETEIVRMLALRRAATTHDRTGAEGEH